MSGEVLRVEAALQEAVGASHVSSGQRALGSFTDAGFSPETPLYDRAWVCHPGAASEVAEILRIAGREGLVVVPVGTGSTRSAAFAAHRPRVILDMRRMSNVLHLDEQSLIVHAQAGLTARALEELLAPRGLTLGDFPPNALGSTLGGLFAARAPGRVTPRHGFLEDACLGVSAVLADGRTMHTRVAPRRATGPDLSRLLLGSEGTLAVITAVVMRIDRRPETRLYDAHAFNDVVSALETVRDALADDARPTAMGIFDAASLITHYGAEALPAGIDTRTAAVLVAATAGPKDLAAVDRDIIATAAQARRARPLGPQLAETWWTRRAMAYGLVYAAAAPLPPGVDARRSALEAATAGGPRATAPLPIVDLEVWAPLGKLATLYQAAMAQIREHRGRPRGHLGRFDADGGVLFVSAEPPLTPAARSDLIAVLASLGGEVARSSYGDLILARHFNELKRVLDPAGILNPDRAPHEVA